MKLKKGVKLNGVKPELAFVMPLINGIVEQYDKKEGCVATSLCDGKHRRGSLHYVGLAIDIRSRNITKRGQKACLKKLKVSLGAEFDVILHPTHYHVEYQPK